MYSSRIYLQHLNGHGTGGIKAGRVIRTGNRFYIDIGPNKGAAWVIADKSYEGIKKSLYDLLTEVTHGYPTADDLRHDEYLECKPLLNIYIDIDENGVLIDFGDTTPEKVQKEKEYNMQVYLLVKDYGIF